MCRIGECWSLEKSLRHQADSIRHRKLQIRQMIRWGNATRSSIPLAATILVGCHDASTGAPSKFDGTYVGTGQLTRDNPGCPQSPPSVKKWSL
jgi:hypothetical protein